MRAVRNVVAVQSAIATAAVITPIAVQVPNYSVGYVGDEVNQALLEELRAIRAELQQMRASGGGGIVQQQAAPVPKGLQVMNARCAMCHDASVSKAKAKGITLFANGKFLDEGDLGNRVLEQIDSGKMPKGGKLSDGEKYDILWYLTVSENKDANQPGTQAPVGSPPANVSSGLQKR